MTTERSREREPTDNARPNRNRYQREPFTAGNGFTASFALTFDRKMKTHLIAPILSRWFLGSLVGALLFYVPLILHDLLSGREVVSPDPWDWFVRLLSMMKSVFLLMIAGVLGAVAIRRYGVTLSPWIRAMLLVGIALMTLVLVGLWNLRFLPLPSLSLEIGHVFLIVVISNLVLLPITSPETGVGGAKDTPDPVAG